MSLQGTADACSEKYTSPCACLKDTQCGLCVAVEGSKATQLTRCILGSASGPQQFGGNCSSITNADGVPGIWSHNVQNCSESSAAAAIAGPVAGVGACLLFLIVWWVVRGRWWWKSTSHKRGCCHEHSCCNGGPGCHPYEPVPPPRVGLFSPEGGRKSTAVRVGPCWPHNPCGHCMGGHPDKRQSLEEHPPGLGCACACEWCPGCCCFWWPSMCRKRFCLDEQPRVPGELENAVRNAIKTKGRSLFSCFGGKKNSRDAHQAESAAPPPHNQNAQGGRSSRVSQSDDYTR